MSDTDQGHARLAVQNVQHIQNMNKITWNSVLDVFLLCRLKRWCRRHSNVRKMASAMYNCDDCKAYFFTLKAAVEHACKGDSPRGHVLSTNTEDSNKRNTLYFCSTCKAWFDAHHECSASEDPGQTEKETKADSSTMSASDKGNWSKEATLFLIQEYRKHEEKGKSGSMRKKVLWGKIASSMQGNGYSFNGDQVAGRWKTLIRGYKNVKDHNSKSGNNPQTYEYEQELDNIFGDDPSVMPKVTDSSLKRPRAVDKDETEESSSSSSIEMPKSDQKRTRRSYSAHVVDMLKTYIEQQNTRQAEEAERRERMHRERLSVIESLEKAVIEKKKETLRKNGFLFVSSQVRSVINNVVNLPF